MTTPQERTLPPLPDRLVVGLDGRVFGDRALPVARELAIAIGAELTLLSVVEYAVDFEARAAYLADLHHQYNGHLDLLFETDARGPGPPCARRASVPGDPRPVGGQPFTPRGPSRLAEVAAGRPAVLVGYSCAVRTPGGPVVLPIGGGVDYDESLALAAAWAMQLDVEVSVVTATPGARRRADPVAARAVDALNALGVKATATILEIGDEEPVRALVHWSRDNPSALIVAPSTIESGQPPALLRSHIADLVSRVRAPVLVVPSRALDQR